MGARMPTTSEWSSHDLVGSIPHRTLLALQDSSTTAPRGDANRAEGLGKLQAPATASTLPLMLA